MTFSFIFADVPPDCPYCQLALVFLSMKYTTYVLLLMFVTGCRPDTAQTLEGGQIAIQSLLPKFRTIVIDTFEVYSTYELEKENYAFRGTRLDSIDLTIFPIKEQERLHSQDIYGCYKFAIDSAYTGLIARTPSEYGSSSIKLFVLDISRNEITDAFIELGEATGDGGYSMTRKSLIFKDGQELRYLIWLHESENMSDANENDTTIKTSDYLKLLAFHKGAFVPISTDIIALMEKYKSMTRLSDQVKLDP